MCCRRFFLFFLLLGANMAHALDYRSVSVPVAIFYDAPSAQGEKLYLVREGTPLEVLVQIEGWTKVRDAEGTIAWIERGALSLRRTAIVISNQAEVRKSANDDAPIVFTAEKWLILDLLEDSPPGWAKVRHRDGAGGFVRLGKVWGL
ncbi:MAG: SH3 domain-containing protein [Betaproteobacteria bacterium]|nr:SH3 domain-containing protein [Betaproteobacteria bacterium]